MSLTTYNQKRNFRQSPEPAGKKRAKGSKLSFVVQRHDASHLHYDFRLEVNGVLKSWAVPKGPSLNPDDKRLAVMVEDHPLAYGKFEGEIPAGNYGAGTVEIWDKGTYEAEETDASADVQKQIDRDIGKGSLKFTLHGKRLKGSFALVQMKKGNGKNWLLIKHKDEYAITKTGQGGVDDDARKISKTLPRKTVRAAKKSPAKKSAPVKKAKASAGTIMKVNGHALKVTNLDKLYWPKEAITKGDVLAYYNEVSKYILPYLKGRPQSLKRNPNGIDDKGFYHKDAGDEAPDWVDTISLFSESANKDIDYIVCNNKATLLYLNNLGCIEINPWNSRTESLDNPDYLVMDIDPSDNNTFDQVIDTALAIKEILDRAGAVSFCKTSGASGLHVYVPLGAKYSYDDARAFAQIVATLTQEQLPFTTMERSLNKRKGRIYLDYLQNKRGQTLASVYSLRPVPGASVSTPLEWKEVKQGLTPAQFTLKNIAKRLQKKGDLFKPILSRGINMERCLHRLSS